MSELVVTVPVMDDLVESIRDAAGQLDTVRFLELLRWYRAVARLPDLDWAAPGSYRRGVEELSASRAADLLRDVRRAARDPRSHRRGADGKSHFRPGQTLESLYGP